MPGRGGLRGPGRRVLAFALSCFLRYVGDHLSGESADKVQLLDALLAVLDFLGFLRLADYLREAVQVLGLFHAHFLSISILTSWSLWYSLSSMWPSIMVVLAQEPPTMAVLYRRSSKWPDSVSPLPSTSTTRKRASSPSSTTITSPTFRGASLTTSSILTPLTNRLLS